MASWIGNVELAGKLIRLGLDVNETQAVGGQRNYQCL